MTEVKSFKDLLKKAENWKLRWSFEFRVEIFVENRWGELLVETDFGERFHLHLPVSLCVDLAVLVVRQHCLDEIDLWVEGKKVNLKQLVEKDVCE